MGAASGGPNVIILMTIGVVGGIIVDMMWNSLGLPGYNVPLTGCDALSLGDAVQIGSNRRNNISRISYKIKRNTRIFIWPYARWIVPKSND